MLDSARLLFDLQRVNAIGQSFSGCLDPDTIAHHVTDALVERFDCAFARIWLTDPDQKALTLVASSGLYTHTNGSFAQVPMGAYKVGKIAQNRVPFLSNRLSEESWVKDRDWAIANHIHGFAGYPLMSGTRVLGVLATFSHKPFAPEFLEVLQLLCLTATIALDAALQAQRNRSSELLEDASALSDQLARGLTSTQLMLVGTEQPLSASIGYLVMRSIEQLNQLHCSYCRLTYESDRLLLEAIVAMKYEEEEIDQAKLFSELQWIAENLGGSLLIQPSKTQVLEFLLQLPYQLTKLGLKGTERFQSLSEREHQVISLLAQGYRDRDIAKQLHISESTVKFHVNNTLAKLKAKNRYQAVYEATSRKWI